MKNITLTVSQAQSWILKLILIQITGMITNMKLLYKILQLLMQNKNYLGK